MAKLYYDADTDQDAIRQKRVAIIGYGSQGHAHALNLRDSGCDVVVGLPQASASRAKAEQAGIAVRSVADAVREADVIMVLIPDQHHREVYERDIRPHLAPGNMLMFAHGFAIHYSQVVPPPNVDVSMVAPKSPGHMVRRIYEEGAGVPSLFAIYQDASGEAEKLTLSYASALGSGRAGILRTTFAEETETDLFGEQSVLCGGVTALVQAGFETLVNAGYQPEIAYFECLHELKLIVDLVYQGGLGYMRYSVSDTAEYGDYTAGPRIINDAVRETMRGILSDIQDGSFATRWILENQAGRPSFNAMRRNARRHQIEQVGQELRSMMSWLQPRADAAPEPPADQENGRKAKSEAPVEPVGARTGE